MASLNSPQAEIEIDEELVKRLLVEQQPDLADLPVRFVSEGWDNALFQLGSDLVVRLPRRHAAVTLIRNEQRWLSQLAPRLPLPIPVPIRHGLPSATFGWPWSICTWVEGRDALRAPLRRFETAALQMATFLRALHTTAVAEAPLNPFRGIALAGRNDLTMNALVAAESAGLLSPDRAQRVREFWHEAVAAPVYPGPPVWLHGDLHPGNVIVRNERIVAVVDWGDITAGDPACDLAVFWRMFDASSRDLALQSWGADRSSKVRARGWAIAIALVLLTNSADRPLYLALGHRSIDAVLAE